ncbi:hypothetical protein B0H14DRAFT_3506923 [Mycena olivaceomarginata]|nr:hypothetical protein B0H14DRAFT_3506923 [Mycena olivaceomarginata]
MSVAFEIKRKVYLKHPNVTFWDKLDNPPRQNPQRRWRRRKENYKAFCPLEEDQKTRGQVDVAINDDDTAVDEFQQGGH